MTHTTVGLFTLKSTKMGRKCTWNEIHKSLIKALNADYHQCAALDAIARAPYGNITVKITLSGRINEDCYNVPIHINIKEGRIKDVIIREFTTQLVKFGDIWIYDEEPLKYEDLYIGVEKVVCCNGNDLAIFHVEQECGFAWLCVSKADMYAPFTYDVDYGKKTPIRKETNQVYHS